MTLSGRQGKSSSLVTTPFLIPGGTRTLTGSTSLTGAGIFIPIPFVAYRLVAVSVHLSACTGIVAGDKLGIRAWGVDDDPEEFGFGNNLGMQSGLIAIAGSGSSVNQTIYFFHRVAALCFSFDVTGLAARVNDPTMKIVFNGGDIFTTEATRFRNQVALTPYDHTQTFPMVYTNIGTGKSITVSSYALVQPYTPEDIMS